MAAWRAAGPVERLSGAQVRTYRLAFTFTSEYAITKGNTTASVLAAEVATLNRVVGVFKWEVAVRLVLVAHNDQLIFLSGTGPQPAPSLTNGDKFAMLDQNQVNVDRVIGDANYDIGHIICTSGGGVAGLGVVCYGGSKARGVSTDDVKVIYHEMGHQLGASHTFNTNDSNRYGSSAWEPGAGTTMVSYGGGIFGPADELQSQRDDVFHTGSYEQMQAAPAALGEPRPSAAPGAPRAWRLRCPAGDTPLCWPRPVRRLTAECSPPAAAPSRRLASRPVGCGARRPTPCPQNASAPTTAGRRNASKYSSRKLLQAPARPH